MADELSFNNFGHAKIRRLRSGRLLQDFVSNGAGYDQVFAQGGVGGLIVGEDLRHGLDLGSIQLIELADVLENFVNLFAIAVEFGLAEVQVREVGDANHVFTTDFHRMLSATATLRGYFLAM